MQAQCASMLSLTTCCCYATVPAAALVPLLLLLHINYSQSFVAAGKHCTYICIVSHTVKLLSVVAVVYQSSCDHVMYCCVLLMHTPHRST
jgi:hypothetical protein